jgi:hypothetical protein
MENEDNQILDLKKFVEDIVIATKTEHRGAITMFGLKTAVEMHIGTRILELSEVKI